MQEITNNLKSLKKSPTIRMKMAESHIHRRQHTTLKGRKGQLHIVSFKHVQRR